MVTYVKEAQQYEREIFCKYIAKCSILYGSCMLFAYVTVTIFLLGPVILSTSFPLDAEYPFSVNYTPVNAMIYLHQSFVCCQCAANICLCISGALLLWFTAARFECLAMEFKKSSNIDMVITCIKKQLLLRRYANEVISSFRLLILYTTIVTTFTITLSCIIVFMNPPLIVKVQFMAACLTVLTEVYMYAWPADHMKDMSANVSRSVYDITWYEQTLEMQKDLLNVLVYQKPMIISITYLVPELSLRYYCSVRGLINVWSISVDSIIECIPPIVTILLQVASYFNLIFNTEKLKDILLFVKNDHSYYMNRPENMILQYYAKQGSKIIFYYVSYVYITIVAFILIPTVSLISELINHSEERSLPIEIDYGVDIQEYFYYLFIPLYISMFIVPHVIASCDSTYLLYVHHACALFAIVSYELKTIHIFDTSSLINLNDYDLLEKYKDVELSPGEQKKIFRKLLLCIKRHQNAIRYSNLVESFFTKSILTQMFCNVISLSIGGVETVLNLGNTSNVVQFGALALAQAIHIFILCFPGQTLLNHSEEVYAAACEVVWYIFPKKCHNLYMFLLTKTMVFNKITAFKFSVMSMETFLSIIQTAMSYFTVLLSTT